MSDEMERKDQGVEPAPAPAERIVPDSEAFEVRLESLGVGTIRKTVDWLGRMMPKEVSDGVKLPALNLMDPTKTAQYKSFLEKAEFEKSRMLLRQRLSVWIKAIEAAEDLDDIHEKAEERVDQTTELLQENLKNAFETIRPIEKTYRAINGFFVNAQVEPGKPVDAWFFNCDAEQLLDTDDPVLFEYLAEKIREEFKFFSLSNVYSNLVIPQWPGGVQQVDRLGKLGEMYKVQVFVDTEDYGSFNDLIQNMDLYEGIKGSSTEKQYVVLCGNHVMSRAGYEFEEDDVYVSPAAHVAGLVYRLDETLGTHEASAGYKKGPLQGPIKARFRLDNEKISTMQNYGVLPVADWDNQVRSMGDWNLCDKEGQDTYARIRTEDWIIKNVCHYLNKQTFSNIDNKFLSAVQNDLRRWLNTIKGESQHIVGFLCDVRASDEDKKNHRVNVNLQLEFKQSVHQFNVRVTENTSGQNEVEVS